MCTYKLNIGDRLKNDTRDLTITNRKIVNKKYTRKNGKQFSQNQVYYQFICNKCGFDSGEYHKKGIHYDEYWIEQGNLLWREDNCPCCQKIPKVIVPHINSIVAYKETEWMISYFQGGYEEAKMYSPHSNQKKYFVCPYCKRIKDKKISINELNRDNGCHCICEDGISYPNKYGFELFSNQLSKQLNNFKREYQPEWAKPYYYDFYFEKDNNKYICEFDGGLGHGREIHRSSSKTVEDSIQIDRIKDELAKTNDIQLIRIDTSKSNSDYISNNILKSKLSKIFDFSTVDFKKCDEFACNNLVKIICEDFENSTMTNVDLSKKYNLSIQTIVSYIKHGRNIGWCKRKHIMPPPPIIIPNKIRMLFDDGSSEIFESAQYLEDISLERFGIKLYKDGIRRVCNGIRKKYHGYKFEYVK